VLAEKAIMDEIETLVHGLVGRAQAAARRIANLSTHVKNEALLRMAAALEAEEVALTTLNARDIERAQERGLSSAMIDRLRLTPKRIGDMARGLREITHVASPEWPGRRHYARTPGRNRLHLRVTPECDR
jgi:glutamate-5-semialdehyde dehydrogenase